MFWTPEREMLPFAQSIGSRLRGLLGTIASFTVAGALGGAVGLVVLVYLRHRGVRLNRHPRLAGLAFGAVGLTLVVGVVARMTFAVVPIARCPVTYLNLAPEPTVAPTTTAIENVATAAPTGLALIYAAASGAQVCTDATGEVIAMRDQGFVDSVGKGAIIGEVFLSWNLPGDTDPALAAHENRHVAQWTVATAIGGPLAFPVAYGVTDFFFPGGANPFERDAGLAAGQYDPATPFAPVLGTAQIAVLLLVAADIALLLVRTWVRRHGRAPDRLPAVQPVPAVRPVPAVQPVPAVEPAYAEAPRWVPLTPRPASTRDGELGPRSERWLD